ncbi:MAG: hypothetical protein Q9167_001488 [Letrouitia subvulpina]
MATPTLDKFLGEIGRLMRKKDGAQMQNYLLYEPPWPPLYEQMISELRQTYPEFNKAPLEQKCTEALPADEDDGQGSSFSAFIAFLHRYFAFIRDVDVGQLVETHDKLKSLLSSSSQALSQGSGLIILPTIISISRVLARLAIGLDKRPDLVANLTRREATIGGDEAEDRITLAEGSANLIRENFKKCASERSGNPSGVDNAGRPEGRRIGIYLMANVCLKLFFHCRKLRSAEQIFAIIYQQSPPLRLYPAAQRVTFFYYLGRYHFANNHFFRAQLALQVAYDQCHQKALKQRRLILIYLIAANLILGRFPSQSLYQHVAAQGFASHFQPICRAITKGDIASFRTLTDINNKFSAWFLHWRILLQISNRCEVLIWRSLARRTFLIAGNEGDIASKRAPTLDLQDLLILATFLKKRGLVIKPKSVDTNSFFLPTPANTPPAEKKQLIDSYVDPDLVGCEEPSDPDLPTMETVEAMIASLVAQEFLHGFVSHGQKRFAITGAKTVSPVQVGFPNVWRTISAKSDIEVPGWVTKDRRAGGTVIHMSGARAAGS